MDSKILLQLLQATYSPNTQERRAAEEQLSKLEAAGGYSVALLQISAANEVDVSLRQAASIYFKKIVRNNWKRDPEDDPNIYYTISDADKKLIKDNIVEVLVHSPEKIRAQIGVCIREIVEHEFPENWPELIPKCMHFLSTKDANIMMGALVGLRETFKRYEYVQPGKGRRQPVNQLVDTVFPVLLELSKSLLAMDNAQAALMLVIVEKTFWTALNYGLPPYITNDTNFLNWMSMFMTLLQKPLPSEVALIPAEERDKYPWWKAKKWAANIFQRLYSRYYDPKMAESKSVDVIEFSKRFASTYSAKLLEAFLGLLSVKRTGGYLPNKITFSAIQFITVAIRDQKLYTLIKPHMQALFTDVMFPMICFNEEDQELWEQDPQEYLRKESDLLDEYFSPRSSAVNLLVEVARLRGKNHLQPFMTHVGQLLIKYLQTPPQNRNTKEKHGALYVVGALADKLTKQKEYAGQLEPLLEAHVLPEFASPCGYLRERALWTFTQYFDIEWKKPETYLHALSATVNSMRDPELPVRIRAALNLRFLIRPQFAGEQIKTILPSLLDEYLKLMNEVDNDELISSLEAVIDQFEDQIAPYAVALCTKLTEAFLRLMSSEEEEECAIAAMEVLQAIQTILRSVSDVPQLYPQLEPVLVPLVFKILTPEILEFAEEGIRITSYLTYYSPTISPALWSIFPKLYSVFENWGMDFISELLVPFDNYISRGTQEFLNGPYLNMLVQMYQKVIADDNSPEEACMDAAKLWEVVLQNCRGHIDALIEPSLELTLNRLLKAKKTSLKVLLLEVVGNAIYYNPALVLQIFEKRGWTKSVFEFWFQLVPKLVRVYDKKISIIALSSLLTVPFQSLPPIIKAGSKQIMMTLIKLVKDCEEQKKEIEELEKKAEEEEIDDEDYDDDKELDEDVPENDTEDLATLAKQAKAYYQDERSDSDFNDSDLEDELDDLDEENECSSPLDDVDETIFFIDRIKELATREQPVYEGLVNSLEPATQHALKELGQLAEQRVIQKQKEASENATQQ